MHTQGSSLALEMEPLKKKEIGHKACLHLIISLLYLKKKSTNSIDLFITILANNVTVISKQ